MELRHLKYFAVVAEEENVTRAAARLHVAQPSLSRQIRDLEHELGVALFDHGARALRLTEAGRLFLKEARLALAQVEKAVQTVKNFSDALDGEIHIGYAPSLTTQILPQTLRRFQKKCARVRVRLHDLSTEEMLAGLRAGTLHLAFLVKPSTPALEGLVFHETLRYRACVALPLAHPLSRKKTVRLQELVREPLVAYTSAEYPEYHDWLEAIFTKVRPSPRLVAEYDSFTSLIAAVESGAGLALVQEGFESLAGSRLEVRMLESSTAPLSVGLAWSKNNSTAAIRHFIESATQSDPN